MKHTVLGQGEALFVKQLKKMRRRCLTAAVAAAAVNLLLTGLGLPGRPWLLWANIGVDTACGWYLLWCWDRQLQPRRQRLALYRRGGVSWQGRVLRAEPAVLRIQKLDCRELVVTDGTQTRSFFLPEPMPAPAADSPCTLRVWGNMILEAAYE